MHSPAFYIVSRSWVVFGNPLEMEGRLLWKHISTSWTPSWKRRWVQFQMSSNRGKIHLSKCSRSPQIALISMPKLTFETWNCQVPFLCRWMRWINNTCSGWVDWHKMFILSALQEHSACAWEIVRMEIRENLVQLKKFIDSRVNLWGEPHNHHWRRDIFLRLANRLMADIYTDWQTGRLLDWLNYWFIYFIYIGRWIFMYTQCIYLFVFYL
jgi:hypothetical protein